MKLSTRTSSSFLYVCSMERNMGKVYWHMRLHLLWVNKYADEQKCKQWRHDESTYTKDFLHLISCVTQRIYNLPSDNWLWGAKEQSLSVEWFFPSGGLLMDFASWSAAAINMPRDRALISFLISCVCSRTTDSIIFLRSSLTFLDSSWTAVCKHSQFQYWKNVWMLA